MTTFRIADVKPNAERLSTQTHREAFETLVDSPVEAVANPNTKVVSGLNFHAFFAAVHRSFAEHYALKLKPDNLFITINQGVATIINREPETYRSKFVQHDGKQTISIYRPDFMVGSPDNDWPSCFGDFSREIKTRIGETNHSRFVANFSTTGPVARTVSEIVLMDVVQSFFEFSVWTDCGMPSITLEGTVEDWQKLRDHVVALKEYGGMDWWLDQIIPIMDQFLAARKGTVDLKFWESMYHYLGGSGRHQIDGWVAKLVPYTKVPYSKNMRKNPVLVGGESGIDASELPTAISTVPFKFDGAPYQFIAGHSCVVQDADGAVRPALGWAVRPAPEGSEPTGADDGVLEKVQQ